MYQAIFWLGDSQGISGAEETDASTFEHPVDFFHQCLCVGNAVINLVADDHVEVVMWKGQGHCVSQAKFNIATSIVFSGEFDRWPINVNAYHPLEVIGEKGGNMSSRATDIQTGIIPKAFPFKIFHNAEDFLGLFFTGALVQDYREYHRIAEFTVLIHGGAPRCTLCYSRFWLQAMRHWLQVIIVSPPDSQCNPGLDFAFEFV